MLTLTCFSQAGCRYAKEVWKRGLYRTMHSSRQPDPWGGKTGCHLYLSPVYISFEHFLHFMSSRANWKNSFQLLNYWKNYKSQRDLLGSYPSMCWPKCWELNMLFLSYSQGSYCCLCSQSSPDDITPLTGRIVLTTSSPAKAIVNTQTPWYPMPWFATLCGSNMFVWRVHLFLCEWNCYLLNWTSSICMQP